MEREEMLAKVEAAYDARRTGDFEALRKLAAEDAAFTTAGERSLVRALPGAGGVTVHQAAEELFKTIELRTLERLEAVAEENRIAILWRTTAAVGDGEPFETLMFDLWEFDASGKISKGTQFIDTARFIQEMQQPARA